MAGRAILKYMHAPSDEVLSERWIENPYLQYCSDKRFLDQADRED